MSDTSSTATPGSDNAELRQLYQEALRARDQGNQQLQSYAEQIRTQRIELMRMEQKFEQAEIARDAARAGRAKLEEENRNLQVQYAMLQRKLQEDQIQRGQTQTDGSDANQRLRQENTTLLGEIAGLRHENDELKRLRTEDSERYHQLENQYRQMDVNASVWRRQVEEVHEALRQERAKAQMSAAPLQARILDLEQLLAQTQAQREASQRMVLQREEDARAQAAQHAQALRQAQQENEIVRRRYQETEKKLRTTEANAAEVTSLREELKQAEQQLEQTRRARDASLAIRAQLQEKLEQFQQTQDDTPDNNHLREDLEARIQTEYANRLKENETQLRALKQALDAQINRNALLDGEIQTLRQQAEASAPVSDEGATRARVNELEQALTQANQTKAEAEAQLQTTQHETTAELARLREALDVAQTRAQQYQEQLTATAQQAVADVEAELQEVRQQLAQEQRHWQSQLDARTAQFNALRKDLVAVRENSVPKEEFDRIKSDLRDSRDRVEDARAAQTAAERDLKRLQGEVLNTATANNVPQNTSTPAAKGNPGMAWLLGTAAGLLLTVGVLEALAFSLGRGELLTYLLSAPASQIATTAPGVSAPQNESTPDTKGKPAAIPPKQREFRDKLKQGGNGPILIGLTGGAVELGSSLQLGADEQPKYKITLAPFALGKYETTQAEYGLYKSAAAGENGQLPITTVTWQEAQDYTAWLSAQTGQHYRLPSEAEWEYAMSGGSSNIYWWGRLPKSGMANCFNCGAGLGRAPLPVGQFAANPYGLHDMTGNVREWVQDCYANNYRDRTQAQATSCAQRSVRGGGYDAPMDSLRTTKRDKAAPGSALDNLGFRVARDL